MQRLNTELLQINKDRPYLFYVRRYEGKPINKIRTHLINNANVIIECGFPGLNTEIYLNSYYKIYILINDSYPYKPPHVLFSSPVFHPNIYNDGYICLDILQEDNWKPSMGIIDICKSIQYLLINPNSKSPANNSANLIFIKSIKNYNEQVKKNIKLYHNKTPWD